MFDNVLSRGVKQLLIVCGAELMAAGTIDDPMHLAAFESVTRPAAPPGILSTPLDRQQISPILLIQRIGVNATRGTP